MNKWDTSYPFFHGRLYPLKKTIFAGNNSGYMLSRKTVIDSNRAGSHVSIRELYRYRDLFITLAYRDFKVRYAQTFLGFLWAILQPLVTLLIFIVVFQRAIKIETGNIPYPVYVLAGMTIWSYFSFVMVQAGQSIISAQQMVQKIFFPRLVIPVSKAVVGLVDFLISLMLLFLAMWYYHYIPAAHAVFIPLVVVLLIMFSLGIGIWLSALTVRFRDFQHIIPFVVQIGLYATPVAYPSSVIPEKYHLIYYLNPVTGIVDIFRWSLLGTEMNRFYVCISMSVAVLILLTSFWYFRKTERVMADIV